jgi:hypothetical protein
MKHIEQSPDQTDNMWEKITRREFLERAAICALALAIPEKRSFLRDDKDVVEERINIPEVFKDIPEVDLSSSDGIITVNGHRNFEECRSSCYYTSPLEDVSMVVIHYDDGPRYLSSGEERTVKDTLRGINSHGGGDKSPCVHFCVDGHRPDGEFGVLQAHNLLKASKHLGIALEDETSSLTLGHIGKVTSYIPRWSSVSKYRYNHSSVGIEQIGENFAYHFPDNYPSSTQMANLLGLTIALMKKYDLGIWEVVGHIEVQQKEDPSMEFMSIFRTLIAYYAYQNRQHDREFYNQILKKSGYSGMYGLIKAIERYNDRYGDIYSHREWRNEGKWKELLGLDDIYKEVHEPISQGPLSNRNKPEIR